MLCDFTLQMFVCSVLLRSICGFSSKEIVKEKARARKCVYVCIEVLLPTIQYAVHVQRMKE